MSSSVYDEGEQSVVIAPGGPFESLRFDAFTPVLFMGRWAATPLHHYEAQRYVFTDIDRARSIVIAPNTHLARQWADQGELDRNALPTRDALLQELTVLKFNQNPTLFDLLDTTGRARLLYVDDDPLLGIGADGRGANRYGILLEELRSGVLPRVVRAWGR
jgi:predicted NAD-dependent protein-ADP-ribosyltransferase YbiA (DUF1768 family)